MSNKNYNKMYNKTNNEIEQVVDTAETVIEEAVVTEETVETSAPAKVKYIHGIVTNCDRLNVRKEPNIKAEILRTIVKNTKVIIDEKKSTEEFYRVYSEVDDLDGFVMKDYITVEQ